MGVPKDMRTAFEWYVLVQPWIALVQFKLAGMYREGKEVDLNLQEAFRLYRLSAEQGVVGAQRYLGYFYASGQGVAQNHQEAVRWYLLAADQGDRGPVPPRIAVSAQGNGVPKDIAQARKWYQLAARKGLKDAEKWLLVADQQLGTQVKVDVTEADAGNDKGLRRPWALPGATMQGCGIAGSLEVVLTYGA